MWKFRLVLPNRDPMLTIASQLLGEVSIHKLLQAMLQDKSLPQLDSEQVKTLERIQTRNVTSYSEPDVREEIISPLLGVLGYDKQSYFSFDRNKALPAFGTNIFPDYSVALWTTNFWLIEAKRPRAPSKSFNVSDLRQALGYAAHPSINAALFVLCDGRRIDIYDREEDIEQPIVSVKVSRLRQKIDELRALLSPWQVWFFEKRRIVRQLDRVFDKEFNLTRLEEFRNLIDRRLETKKQIVVENSRSIIRDLEDKDERLRNIRTSDPAELIDGAFFLQFSTSETDAIAETLLRHCNGGTFEVVHRVFPDDVRDMNENYCMHALNFLFHLHMKGRQVNWLPSWLAKGNDLDGATKSFIGGCLTYFVSDPARHKFLLCTAAMRRIFKLAMLVDEQVWNVGHIMHGITRYHDPEDTWEQLVSSPERHNLLHLENLTIGAAVRLARECRGMNTRLQPAFTENRLRELWDIELSILKASPPFGELDALRDLGEIFPSERNCVDYDYLGHAVLCLCERHKKWKAYILDSHLNDVETLALMGSVRALEWLGRKQDDPGEPLGEQAMADRFFLGSRDKYKEFKSAYGSV